MNELLQKHGCANVFTVPEGLRELMSDISREVLREQPPKIFDFIANYLSALMITREHGILAVKVLEDLCDCRPSVSEHLLQAGLQHMQASAAAQIIKDEIEGFEPEEGKEKIREMQIVKKLLTSIVLDEELTTKVCQIVRNTYKEYWYRKKLLEQNLKIQDNEPWEIAVQHTLEIYKRTKPSYSELSRATKTIQAAYRGYHVRRNLLQHLKPKPKKQGPKLELPGPPLDIAASREIDLGPVINVKPQEDNVTKMFDEHIRKKVGLPYDTQKTLTHVEDTNVVVQQVSLPHSSRPATRISYHLEYPAPHARGIKSTSPIPELLRPEHRRSYYSASQKSDLSSDSPPFGSPKRWQSVSEVPYNIHKISFAQEGPIVIPQRETREYEDDVTAEVPEDIAVERSDADGASGSAASLSPATSVGTAGGSHTVSPAASDIEDDNVSAAEEE